MSRTTTIFSLLAGVLLATTALAQAPASAPAGSTGQCKDGTYWSNPTKKGACRGHKGVQTWYGSAGAAPAAAPAPAAATKTAASATPPATPGPAPAGATGMCKDGTYWTKPTKQGACRGHKGIQNWYAGDAAAPSTAAVPAPARAPAPTAAAAPKAAPATSAAPAPSATAAPGAGPGLVWVNTPSKVYHCSGDRWYGKTKAGSYMSEAAAKAAGDRPDHGKPCS